MHSHPPPLHPIVTADPFTKWGLDFMDYNPGSAGGHHHIIVAVDYFTKWAEAMPTVKSDGETAEELVEPSRQPLQLPLLHHACALSVLAPSCKRNCHISHLILINLLARRHTRLFCKQPCMYAGSSLFFAYSQPYTWKKIRYPCGP